MDDPYRDFETAMKYATELTNSDPNNLQNLFAMANLYETFGHVNEAEAAYKKAFEVAPKDGKACGALAGFYNKTLWDEKGVPITDGGSGVGRFEDAVTQLKICAELDPSDPKGFYTVATFYWDKCYRGGILDDARKKHWRTRACPSWTRRCPSRADFVEALIYKGLLLREQAKLTTNPATRNSLPRRSPGPSEEGGRPQEGARRRPRRKGEAGRPGLRLARTPPNQRVSGVSSSTPWRGWLCPRPAFRGTFAPSRRA